MKITPREYVGRAVTIFEDAFRACLVKAGTATPKDRVRDAQAMLGYMLDEIDSLFPGTVRSEARTYIHELRSTRNKLAHSEPLEFDDAYRAADTVTRLLKLLGSDDMSAASLRRDVRSAESPEATFAETVKAVSPHASGASSTVNIIACSKLKKTRSAPAVELYTGPLFLRSLEVAQADAIPVLILSTKYGLVDPTAVLEPYELSLKSLTPSERVTLTDLLRKQLRRFVDGRTAHAYLLGGKDYLSLLREALGDRRMSVEQHHRWAEVWRSVYP